VNGRQGGPVDLGIGGITDAVEIGAGGFGVVYRAIEADLGRTVAVKVLSGNLDESAQYRFERERRAMGRLSGHPNIVTIYRGGYTTAGNAYLVMEFLERGSLADRLSTAGPLGWEEVLMFGVQLSGALETSHRAGVLHRDIKPGNILLSSLGNAKLCDFGIARLQGAPETKSSVVTASLSHAPPDIVSGERPDARSDVYSLASTLFELVAATAPFVRPDDESMVPILARIARDPVPRLPEAQLPSPVFEVIERAMAKDPGDRPETAVELGTLLATAQQRLGLPATTIPIEAADPNGGSGGSGYTRYP
jgi:serine/threonine protein kinase